MADEAKQRVIFRITLEDSGGEDIIVYREEVKELIETGFPGLKVTVEEIE
jgi:hypothetical protein